MSSRFVESRPAGLPDPQFAEWIVRQPRGDNSILVSECYQHNQVGYAHTTDGQPVTFPYIWYSNYAEYQAADPAQPVPEYVYADKVYIPESTTLPEAELTEAQRQAVTRAAVLEHMRQTQDPARPTFSDLRRLVTIEGGLLAVCDIEEGNGMDEKRPYAAVRSATHIGSAIFATAAQGYPLFFGYNQPDVGEFIPDHLRPEQPNAYAFFDDGQLVTVRENDYQLRQIGFFRIEADMDYPLPEPTN